jgi:hypothetical protein
MRAVRGRRSRDADVSAAGLDGPDGSRRHNGPGRPGTGRLVCISDAKARVSCVTHGILWHPAGSHYQCKCVHTSRIHSLVQIELTHLHKTSATDSLKSKWTVVVDDLSREFSERRI